MNLDLAGKVALVTGGSRGIGAAVCRALAAEGVRVGVNYATGAERAAGVVDAIGGGAVALQGDLERVEVIPGLFDALERRFGPVDILVNNAARCPGGSIDGYSVEEWERTFRVNVTAAFVASREHVRRLRGRRAPGRIVNIVSQAAFLGSTSGHLPYDASKGALVSMTRAVARETAAEGITVNAVAPGMVMTELVAGVWEAKKEHYLARIPLKRIAQPEEIANAVVFLASAAAGYITGTTLDLTGGLLMR
jgi:3-oxoacyl-[acyl-carrier protein] reductase